MSLGHGAGIVTNGLVLYLDAANKKSYPGSGTVWNNLGGNGNNGTLVNGPTYNTSNTGSFVFDGVNDYISGLGGAIVSTTEISVCLWNYGQTAKISSAFWFTDSVGGYSRICQVHLPYSDNIVYFDCGSTGGTVYDRISKAVSASEYQGWHYWAFTKNVSSGIMSIYLDGTLWHSAGNQTKLLRACNVGQLGVTGSLDGFHQGRISSFSVYNRSLSSVEIQHNFNALRGRYGI